MLKKVTLTNVNTGRSTEVVVDTDNDEKALVGAGKAPNEIARTTDITGADEYVHRLTVKQPNLEERVTVFAGIGRCLDRNISTIKSFELLAGRLKSPRYRGAVAEIAHQIALGEKMSDAMAMFPDLFTDDIVALIRAGEESGQLPLVCSQIAQTQRKTLRILKKLRTGLIYPSIVLVMSVAVIIVMAFTLVPSISKLYGTMNAKLPLATILVMKLSETLLAYPWLAALPVFGLWLFFRNWGRIYALPAVQATTLKIPVVGAIVRKSAATVSFRCLAMLLQANVRITTALEITAESASHINYREFFLRVREHVLDGLGLPESFLTQSHLLGADGRTIATIMEIAAETGSATEMLNEIANDYEEELDTIANQIDKILEPMTIVVMGLVVGFLVYAIYGPIFNLSRVILPKKAPAQSAPALPQG